LTLICIPLEGLLVLIWFAVARARPSWVEWGFLPRGLIAISIGMLAVLVLGAFELLGRRYRSDMHRSRTARLSGVALAGTSLSVGLTWLAVFGASNA
jgi:hypothetical protein